MEIEEVLQLKFQIRYCSGSDYPKKPANAKTVKQWVSEGRKPKSLSDVEYFIMPFKRDGKTQAYAYVREENTEFFSERDIAYYKEKHPSKEELAERKQEALANEKENIRNAILSDVAEKSKGNVVCFDVETTGFSPAKGDEILQISIVDKRGCVLLETYIKPRNKTSWPGASQTNHIYPWTVKDAPYSEQVAPIIAKIFGDADAIIGHNVDFDIRFVEQCMNISIDKDKVCDTMKIFRADFSTKDTKGKSFSLESAVKEYCPEILSSFLQGAHDSTTDTKATMAVFLKQAEKGNLLLPQENNSFISADYEIDEPAI